MKPGHHIQEISARTITERKDLNRATFYLHYKNTYDLLQDVEEDFFEHAQEMFDKQRNNLESTSIRPLFEGFLDYIIENRAVCEARKPSGDMNAGGLPDYHETIMSLQFAGEFTDLVELRF